MRGDSARLRYLTGDDHDRATTVLELLHRVESGRERVVTGLIPA